MSATLKTPARTGIGASAHGSAPGQRRSTTAHITVAALLLFSLFPVAWMALTAFTSNHDIFQFPPSIQRSFTLEHFTEVLTNATLLQFMVNGLIVATTTTVISLFLGFTAGYSFSKFRYYGRTPLMYLILVAQMVPEVLLLLSLYASFNALGLLNTYGALILSYSTFTLPLAVWMMKNSFDAIPSDLIEAGRIDGASELRIMITVLLPVCRTSLIAVGLFAFIRAWNDLAYALTLVDTPLQTLPAGLSLTFLGEFQNSYGQMMAASLVTSLPVIAVFLLLQKHFVSGALAGSVK
ncbi:MULTISPECIES: carbohydrate ABC transporter permease [Pseudarthrobacter]|uniref:carbohydrate ABC transporter permease n=1 Tax=Pseudarthrobacter TaxID=1742993 RepID=UPI002041CCA9|nr:MULTISPECIES: carbohydrate ABC transporter permease [Pseudarthrobacter]WPU09483.1 carbohydrate ABC transporter permease [Pseudarthrobacter oxydans]GKV71927.1 ABC transporter permease [Pseudarthrobacter sp. NCCP-2145]